MRILVYPVKMEIGGSQLNAVELAHETARRGHEVILFGPDGALVPMVRELGLEYVRMPREHRWPSGANLHAVRKLVRERAIDVVHGYEWSPCLDLAFGPHALDGTPLVMTVMSMQVPGYLPRHAPLIVGTRALAAGERARRTDVTLMEPPIDLAANAPGDGAAARAALGIRAGDIVVTVVGRLTPDLGKLDGVLDAIEAVGRAGGELPLRLLAIGDGPGLGEARARADRVNAALGREAISVPGPLLDPRPAYDAADVVLGMGTSAIKGMAFAKPLVVGGEDGFWRALEPETLPWFLEHGWHGSGGDGADALEPLLRALAGDPARRAALGQLGRDTAERHYGLGPATDALVDVYERARASRPRGLAASREIGLSALRVLKAEAVLAARRRGWAT